MKLHSDFHDYYDTAISYGVDAKLHYNRLTEKVVAKLEIETDLPTGTVGSAFLLGFCGRIFPFIEIKDFDDRHQVISRGCAYTYENFFERLLQRAAIRERLEQTLWRQNKKQNEKEIRKLLTKELSNDRTKQFFADWSKQDNSLFLKYQVPVWLFECRAYQENLTLNPRLTDYQFWQIKDANAAFQEISMYLAVLVEQKEPAQIADRIKIEQHGFDLQTSFRK